MLYIWSGVVNQFLDSPASSHTTLSQIAKFKCSLFRRNSSNSNFSFRDSWRSPSTNHKLRISFSRCLLEPIRPIVFDLLPNQNVSTIRPFLNITTTQPWRLVSNALVIAFGLPVLSSFRDPPELLKFTTNMKRKHQVYKFGPLLLASDICEKSNLFENPSWSKLF